MIGPSEDVRRVAVAGTARERRGWGDGGPRLIPNMSLYQRLCHDVVLPASDLLLKQRVHSRVGELLTLQWASADELEACRGARLRDLVAFSAARVPWYRRRYQELGLRPADVAGPEQLPLLPILDKQTIRDCFNELRVDQYSGRTYEMNSSGSTGMQTTVLLDKDCYRDVFATQLLFWSWGGFAMGRRHVQTGMSVNRGLVKRAKDAVFRCTYTSAFDLTDDTLAGLVRHIDRKRIRALFGYASSLYVIAKFLDQRGMRRPMDAIFTWGDSLFPHYRELIERVFEHPVNDCYGLGEGLQCAAQCEAHGVLHEAMFGVIMEIVDHHGAPCAPGVLGRVLVTRLEPGPMPLIRYDTGDVAYFVDEPCPCGRRLRGVSRIQGRATDVVTTPAGDRMIVHFFTQIFELIPQIAQFQVRQETPDAIRILVVAGQGFHAGLLEDVRRQILAASVFPLKITFDMTDAIPLAESNKRRFVISSVPF